MSTTELSKPEKTYKQSPEVREYFRKKAENRRIKERKCADCGDQLLGQQILIVKDVKTNKQRKLCLKCFVKEQKKAQEEKQDG